MLKLFGIMTVSAFAVLSSTSLEVLADSKSSYTNTYDMKCPDGNWKHSWKKISGHYHMCTDGYQGDEAIGSKKYCNDNCATTNDAWY